MQPWEGKRMIAVVSACMAADGTPTFAINEVEVTHEEYENGIHYPLAEDRLVDDGFEEPFVHFDQFEGPAFLHPAVRQYLDVADPITLVHEEEA